MTDYFKTRAFRSMEFRAQRKDYENIVDFVLVEHQGEKRFCAKPFNIEMYEVESYITEPTMSLPMNVAQQMVDELYRLGFKPSDKVWPVENKSDIKYHLEDMRKLVFEGMAISPDRVKLFQTLSKINEDINKNV